MKDKMNKAIKEQAYVVAECLYLEQFDEYVMNLRHDYDAMMAKDQRSFYHSDRGTSFLYHINWIDWDKKSLDERGLEIIRAGWELQRYEDNLHWQIERDLLD